jgi:hypothetical protein
MKKLIITALAVATVSGCAVIPPKKPACNVPNMTDEEKRDVSGGYVSMGMREELVLCSWGYPTSVNKTTTSSGTRKQYVYRGYTGKTSYVYTVNGKVTAWQN